MLCQEEVQPTNRINEPEFNKILENERIKHTENVIFNLPKDKISKTGLDIHEKENKIKSFAKKDTMDTIFNE